MLQPSGAQRASVPASHDQRQAYTLKLRSYLTPLECATQAVVVRGEVGGDRSVSAWGKPHPTLFLTSLEVGTHCGCLKPWTAWTKDLDRRREEHPQTSLGVPHRLQGGTH